MKYCPFCMNTMTVNAGDICGCCGGNASMYASAPHMLSAGSLLNNRYVVGKVIGEGGFGITYLGYDTLFECRVAIKEFYPNGMVTRNNIISNEVHSLSTENARTLFSKSRENFLKEARALAKFSNEPGIVSVKDFFEENHTVYIVMEYLDGITLKEYLKQKGRLSVSDTVSLMLPVFKSLKKVHECNLIHRDISPDNIMLTDGGVKLLDFGAAREFADEKSLSVMLKHGYAPMEQYRRHGTQGAWTDVYAICATMYKCITGIVPPDAPDRVFGDALEMPSELGIAENPAFENVLKHGLAIRPEERIQSMDQLLYELSQALGYDLIFGNDGDRTVLSATQYVPDSMSTVTSSFSDQQTQTYVSAAETIEKHRKKYTLFICLICIPILVFLTIMAYSMMLDRRDKENIKPFLTTAATTPVPTSAVTTAETTMALETTSVLESTETEQTTAEPEPEEVTITIKLPTPEGISGSYVLKLNKGDVVIETRDITKGEKLGGKDYDIDIAGIGKEEYTIRMKSESSGSSEWIDYVVVEVDFDNSLYKITKGPDYNALLAISPEPMSLSEYDITMTVGEEHKLEVFFIADSLNKGTYWETSNTAVVDIFPDSSKLVATGQGTAKITIKSKVGGFTAVCNVTVNDLPYYDWEIGKEQMRQDGDNWLVPLFGGDGICDYYDATHIRSITFIMHIKTDDSGADQGRIKMFEDKYQWDYPGSNGYFFDRSIILCGNSTKHACAFRQIGDDTYAYTQYITATSGYIFTEHNGVGQLRIDIEKGGSHVKEFYPEKVILNPAGGNEY